MSKFGVIDQVMFKLETSGMAPMVMGGAMILDPVGSRHLLDGKKLVEHLAARMERIPMMRKKPVQDGLRLGSMRLVDDPGFDVRNHISLISLKAPGGYKELTEALGMLSAQRLDLNRPLWHYEVIEGLKDGRLAVVTHLHHSLVDGIGAMEALSGIWDLEPVAAEKPRTSRWQVADTATTFGLLQDAVTETIGKLYLRTPKFVWKSASPLLKLLLKSLAARFDRNGAARETGDQVVVPKVHKTSINVARVSPRRVISYVEMPIAEVKALSRHFNCSINDLTILFNSYALQHYFSRIGEPIDFDLVVGIPISIRKPGEKSAGNMVTAARLSMHNRIEDIEERLRAIVSDTASIKRQNKPEHTAKPAVDPMALMELFSPIVFDALFFGIAKLNLLNKLTVVNVGVTNVPGSPLPMYMGGARLVGMVPMAPVIDTVGLTICVSSSDTDLVMGFHGCGVAIQNKELFVEGALKAFNVLKKSANLHGGTVAGNRPAKSANKSAAKHPIRRKPAARKLIVKRRTR